MPNQIWQAEEEKWERRRQRAEKALSHIRELRRLEAEEEAAELPVSKALTNSTSDQAGQTSATIPPISAKAPAPEETKSKRTTRDAIPDLLRINGPMTTNAIAEALGVSTQAVNHALTPLEKQGLVVREPSTVPGFRIQFRLATEEELEEQGGLLLYQVGQEGNIMA